VLPHDEILEELVEWFEDVAGGGGSGGVGARCVVLPVPSGWGRSTLMSRLERHISQQQITEALVCRIDGGEARGSLPVQARWLCQKLEEVAGADRLRRVLGVDTTTGKFDAGVTAVDAAGLIGGRSLMLANLVKTLGLNALGLREDAEAKQCVKDVERMARRVSSASVRRMPVVVLIDNAEEIDERLLDRAVSEIIGPAPSRSLVIVACDPSSTQIDVLTPSERFGPVAGRFHRLAVDAGMGFDERMILVSELAPSWPPEAREHLASRSRDFATVFKALDVRAAGDVGDAADPVSLVDRLVESVAPPDQPTLSATVVSWCGGFVNREVYSSIVDALGIEADAPDVVAVGDLVRVQPGRIARAADSATLVLSTPDRRTIGEVLVDVAAQTALESMDPLDRIGLAEPVWVLMQREELVVDNTIAELLTALALAHRDVGDDSAARTIAEFVARWDAARGAAVRNELLHLLEHTGADWITDVPEGALSGVEAAVYRIAALLRTTGRIEDGLQLLEPTMQRLDTIAVSTQTDEWRLMLGYRLVRCGHPMIATDVLQPLLSSGESDSRRIRAEWVLRTVGDVGELHLQRAALLESWLLLTEASQEEADGELIALADAISDLSNRLGDWQTALQIGDEALAARVRVLGADHPTTLIARRNIAEWTRQVGDLQRALALYQELLPDFIRVLSAEHPGTLITRGSIAYLTGQLGDSQSALTLHQELLPDFIRVLGADHPTTLNTRGDIATLTAQIGDPQRALTLYRELLPDFERVRSSDHPDTLSLRGSIAYVTGQVGDPQRALTLSQELLPDFERVLSAEHPGTLITRGNIANLTAQVGDPQRALTLYRELLPDFKRVLSADHPDTLALRGSFAHWTRQLGDPQRALTLYRELLPDLTRVLGAYHPNTLITRRIAALCLGDSDRVDEAITDTELLLADCERVFPAGHPVTLNVREQLIRLRKAGTT
jgi:tetratricopeptide (TPR) repeat protein